jgi:hypothetical protein
MLARLDLRWNGSTASALPSKTDSSLSWEHCELRGGLKPSESRRNWIEVAL